MSLYPHGARGLPGIFIPLATALALTCVLAARAVAQESATPLDSMIAAAQEGNTAVHAAMARLRAARASAGAAGAWPHPMLMAGIVNFPLSEPGFQDFMTMKMVGVEQTLPFPGKRGLDVRAARLESDAAAAEVDATRRRVAREVAETWYDLARIDQLLDLTGRNRQLLLGAVQATDANYQAGRAGQEALLRARVETARLDDERVGLEADRRTAVARLNALIDRPSEVPVPAAAIPARIRRAGAPDSTRPLRFELPVSGRDPASLFPPLDELQMRAIRANPGLAAHQAMAAAQGARADRARREHLPDFNVSLQYGQRTGFPDMVSATVAVPLPFWRTGRQGQQVLAAEATIEALEADHAGAMNDLRSEVAMRLAEAERERVRLALYARSIVPQSRAAAEATAAGVRTGRLGLAELLDARAAVFNAESQYVEALTAFAKATARLEEAVGEELLP